MSRRCAVCAKGPTVGNKVSHAHNLTKRRWLPNLQKIRVEIDGRVKTASVCTACIRTGKIKKVI
ncbi:MAG: 50S ribosomal protein L28 [Candidatus Krumholzibacteria bacterium]|nr:50S ribosomal protein L28 [Candidatus Krumholzibacteria bacterium]MDH4336663.1 50S ribosomal protein L28 [Candidatus Krumholzibacteria bacterium]MDH5269006.1 50S ribosomal protein L28 [Candidatus Krumholzibacteria bacterium]MDH5627463.1 50S ribosomal protein L28 [Candidatus Krumholzibacteria bacterium]